MTLSQYSCPDFLFLTIQPFLLRFLDIERNEVESWRWRPYGSRGLAMRRNIRVESISNSNLFFFFLFFSDSCFLLHWFSLPQFFKGFSTKISLLALPLRNWSNILLYFLDGSLNSEFWFTKRSLSFTRFTLLMNITYDEESHSARILQFGYWEYRCCEENLSSLTNHSVSSQVSFPLGLLCWFLSSFPTSLNNVALNSFPTAFL